MKLWLSNTNEGVMAIYKVCTHLGCLYNWDDQEVRLKCPATALSSSRRHLYPGTGAAHLDRFVVEIVDLEYKRSHRLDECRG